MNNAPKRGGTNKQAQTKAAYQDTTVQGPASPQLVRRLVGENQAGAASQIPTPQEAQEALKRLQEDLPTLGQGANDLHSNLDRSRILSLLAPLVEP